MHATDYREQLIAVADVELHCFFPVMVLSGLNRVSWTAWLIVSKTMSLSIVMVGQSLKP